MSGAAPAASWHWHRMGCGKSSLPKDDEKEIISAPPPTATANAPADTSDDTDLLLRNLLGPPISVARASAAPPDPLFAPNPAPVRAPVAPAAGESSAPAAGQSRGPGSTSSGEAQRLSLKMQKHLLATGVPPPSQEEEPYGLLDDYVDDLLGVRAQDRPADWQRPDMADPQFQDAIRGMTPQIIFADGTKGPPPRPMPTPERMLETYTMPDEFAYKPPSDAKPNVVTPLLDGVLTRWANVDANAVPVKKGDVVPTAKKRVQPP